MKTNNARSCTRRFILILQQYLTVTPMAGDSHADARQPVEQRAHRRAAARHAPTLAHLRLVRLRKPAPRFGILLGSAVFPGACSHAPTKGSATASVSETAPFTLGMVTD